MCKRERNWICDLEWDLGVASGLFSWFRTSYQCLPIFPVCKMGQQSELIGMVSSKAFSLTSRCCIYWFWSSFLLALISLSEGRKIGTWPFMAGNSGFSSMLFVWKYFKAFWFCSNAKKKPQHFLTLKFFQKHCCHPSVSSYTIAFLICFEISERTVIYKS